MNFLECRGLLSTLKNELEASRLRFAVRAEVLEKLAHPLGVGPKQQRRNPKGQGLVGIQRAMEPTESPK